MENEVELEAEYQLMVSVDCSGNIKLDTMVSPCWSDYIEQLFESGSILKGIDLDKPGDYLVDVDLYEDGTTKVVGILYNQGWVDFDY